MQAWAPGPGPDTAALASHDSESGSEMVIITMTRMLSDSEQVRADWPGDLQTGAVQ